MNGQYSISEQKQWETKVKVKPTDATWGQILFSPVTRLGWVLDFKSCYRHLLGISNEQLVLRTAVLTGQ